FSGASDDSLWLSWTDNSPDDAGFIIQVSEDGGVSWATIAATPNDYITLHKNSGFSAIGRYSGLLAGSTRSFRVAATHPVLGQSDFSAPLTVTMPNAADCNSPWSLSPVQSFTAHTGFPIDLRVAINRPASCLSGLQYCVVQGPDGLGVDFN